MRATSSMRSISRSTSSRHDGSLNAAFRALHEVSNPSRPKNAQQFLPGSQSQNSRNEPIESSPRRRAHQFHGPVLRLAQNQLGDAIWSEGTVDSKSAATPKVRSAVCRPCRRRGLAHAHRVPPCRLDQYVPVFPVIMVSQRHHSGQGHSAFRVGPPPRLLRRVFAQTSSVFTVSPSGFG